jgi:hydrogenase-1 operon protein HyaF
LDSINVIVEEPAEGAARAFNAVPVLHEIRHALDKLSQTGESTVIDLSAIPFAPGDERQLLEVLGRGEVEATVDAMGPTRISETGYAGVWLVRYLGASGEEVATHIEITRCPSLLITPEPDVAEAAAALADRLEA